jgi:hypothetical protein
MLAVYEELERTKGPMLRAINLVFESNLRQILCGASNHREIINSIPLMRLDDAELLARPNDGSLQWAEEFRTSPSSPMGLSKILNI